MNSFHMFSRMMVMVSVLVGGNVFGGGNKDKFFTVKNCKLGIHNLTTSATSIPSQAVFVQGLYQVTQSDNAATLGAAGIYLVKNVNGKYIVDHSGKLVANKNASSFVGIAGKTGLYAMVDRSLRAIEGKVSEYGINQKAIIKKAEEYLPETASGVLKEVLPVVVEAGHGFVVRSVTESGAAFVAEKAAHIGQGSESSSL